MAGVNSAVTVQHTTLMEEMEDRFTDHTTDTATLGNIDSSRELQPWRATDATHWRHLACDGGDGSAAQPIELYDSDSDDMMRGQEGTGRAEVAGVDSSASPEGLWGHAVRVDELSPGDQVYVYRCAIQHHGIVAHVPPPRGAHRLAVPAGPPRLSPLAVHVVHFDAACDGVETTSLEAFLKGGTLRRATYSASAWSSGLDLGASYSCPSDDPVLVVTRANEAAKFGQGASGWSGYSLLTNNCETFAFWCSTGRRQTLSRQAQRGLVGAAVVAASVSAVASAGGFASAGIAATAMVPRGVRGIQRTVKAVEWATGVAVVAVTLADLASTVATRSPVVRRERNVVLS